MLWARFTMTSAQANSGWPNMPELEGRVGSVSRCMWCAATATFADSECLQGRLNSLLPITLRVRRMRWLSLRTCTAEVPASSVIPTLARTRVPGTHKSGSSGLSQM